MDDNFIKTAIKWLIGILVILTASLVATTVMLIMTSMKLLK